MAPLLPEHPLTAVGTGERAAPAELHAGRAPDAEQRVARPIHQLPAGAVGVQAADGPAPAIRADGVTVAPSDPVHLIETCAVLPRGEQFHAGGFALATHDDIEGGARLERVLGGIGWEHAAVDDTHVGEPAALMARAVPARWHGRRSSRCGRAARSLVGSWRPRRRGDGHPSRRRRCQSGAPCVRHRATARR